ncbi:type III PLP-dependent enzyme [Caldalkalibacillus salinus]|uniref:type III PLP-dependent enzyme n=1 Tax=Caldalkalibacillus salinus TaxID=2803787 RepID=UPI001F3D74B1|nr:type III PLP-dependent enzyme [Caldalkalibacillus salinus]
MGMNQKLSQQVSQLIRDKERGRGICAYLYDLDKLRSHAAELKHTLPSYCRLFYAIKANPDKQIIRALEKMVDGFEVASLGEMTKVRDVTTKPMIFGAPAKKEGEIEKAAKGDLSLINVESFHDVNRIQSIACQANRKVPVIIRVNLRQNVSHSRIKMAGVATQFGVDENQVPDIIHKLIQCPNLVIRGFHFHAMSNNLDADVHLKFVQTCLLKASEWRKTYDLNIDTVNVGGGIGVNYTRSDESFDWTLFTQGLHALKQAFMDEGIELILELGRYLTAECGYYVSEVVDLKQNHDQCFALLRGGTHHLRLPAAWKMSHPFTLYPVDTWEYPFKRPQIKEESVTMAGELCTPNDVLVRDVYVDQLRVGDLVVFQLAGAYGWTISHHDFLSHPHPDIYYVGDLPN